MEANVEGFEGPLTQSKFAGGQSNPTYKISAPSGNYVLRRKPYGPLLPSAHAVDREYKVQSGLHKMGFRSEEHTSELQSLMRISYAVFCLKKKIKNRSKKQSILQNNVTL